MRYTYRVLSDSNAPLHGGTVTASNMDDAARSVATRLGLMLGTATNVFGESVVRLMTKEGQTCKISMTAPDAFFVKGH